MNNIKVNINALAIFLIIGVPLNVIWTRFGFTTEMTIESDPFIGYLWITSFPTIWIILILVFSIIVKEKSSHKVIKDKKNLIKNFYIVILGILLISIIAFIINLIEKTNLEKIKLQKEIENISTQNNTKDTIQNKEINHIDTIHVQYPKHEITEKEITRQDLLEVDVPNDSSSAYCKKEYAPEIVSKIARYDQLIEKLDKLVKSGYSDSIRKKVEELGDELDIVGKEVYALLASHCYTKTN